MSEITALPEIALYRDYLARFNYSAPHLVSNIMDVRLLHPDTCQEITVTSPSSAPISVNLQVGILNLLVFLGGTVAIM